MNTQLHKMKQYLLHIQYEPDYRLNFSFLKPHALTPGDPTWNPCTVMRTVSPTFALVGDMKSLGPLGAAEKRKEKKTKRQRSSY